MFEFAAFCSSPDAKYTVVPSGFFYPQPWFLWHAEHIFQGKHQHFHFDRHLVTGKVLSREKK